MCFRYAEGINLLFDLNASFADFCTQGCFASSLAVRLRPAEKGFAP